MGEGLPCLLEEGMGGVSEPISNIWIGMLVEGIGVGQKVGDWLRSSCYSLIL
jgi:hypothetical protein